LLLALLVGLCTHAGIAMGMFVRPSFFVEITIFFASANILVFRFVVQRLGVPADFVKVYLGITVLRIIFFGAFIFTLIRIDPSGARENTLFFLVCYFLFTGHEVFALYQKVKT
jgi:hypothetical protein